MGKYKWKTPRVPSMADRPGAQLLALARTDDITAQLWLGCRYARLGDDRKAVEWLKRAADAGDARAMVLYAYHLRDGRGVAANTEEANRLFKLVDDMTLPNRTGNVGNRLLLETALREHPPIDTLINALQRGVPGVLASASAADVFHIAKILLPRSGNAPEADIGEKPLTPSVPAKPAAPGRWRKFLGLFGPKSLSR